MSERRTNTMVSEEQAEEDKAKSAERAHQHVHPAINLRRMYPLTYRSILRRSFIPFLAFALVLVFLSFLGQIRPDVNSVAGEIFTIFCWTILLAALTLLAGKLIFECIYHHVYYYGIELEHIVITCGVFFKTRATFPLAQMTDLYIERGPIDMIFFLHNLKVTTPSPTVEHGAINGLSATVATNLQRHIQALIVTAKSPIDQRAAALTLSESKTIDDPTILSPSGAYVGPT